MRRGYGPDIRTEAITKRYQGKEWNDIQKEINDKFGVKPSIRQMQYWFEAYHDGKEDPTGARILAQTIQDAADAATPLALAKMMSSVGPTWKSLIGVKGLTASDAGWIALLSYFEAQVGKAKFERLIGKYCEMRDELG